jgi:hypothetical protein
MQQQYAEQCNYWKTSKSSPDAWAEKTQALIVQFGGEVLASGFGNDHEKGRAAYMIRFVVDEETFRIIWPVLDSETGDTFAARRQAATMLYHDTKAKCVAAQVLGSRVAFFSWLELPDGRAMFQLGENELLQDTPRMLLASPE